MSDLKFDEQEFQKWYAKHAGELGLAPNPDDPEHHYDYRAAYLAGATPNQEGHWPSTYKREGHPRMIIGGINTKTGERVDERAPHPTGLNVSYYGYKTRQPFESELNYFKQNKNVAGMASEDGKIILNPYSGNTQEQQASVAKNEAIRLFLKDNDVSPDFEVTEKQYKFFEGTEYAKPENKKYLNQTIIARALSGDPSAGELTEKQKRWADFISSVLPK